MMTKITRVCSLGSVLVLAACGQTASSADSSVSGSSQSSAPPQPSSAAEASPSSSTETSMGTQSSPGASAPAAGSTAQSAVSNAVPSAEPTSGSAPSATATLTGQTAGSTSASSPSPDVTGPASTTSAGPSTVPSAAGTAAPPFDGKELFILFGQSNMSGFTPMLEEPWPIDEYITFMVQYDCPRLDQTKDEWLPAEPPLHGCQWATNGLGLGLGDYFGKAMAVAWPGARIGLVPNAIPAVTIDIFMKGGPAPEGSSKALPPGYTSAYTLMIDRAKEAQKLGRVRAILLNQGESDFNQGFGDEWPDKVATVVADLRADLGLTEAVPFIAGEVPPTGNYSGQNANVHKLPDKIPNCAVVTGEGTDVHDGVHYDQASVHLMGDRYAAALLEQLESL